tara:strand:+ start:2661 stop:2852 length:192 start_codon:yes stop_codon:yes gene_type:complete
MNYYYELLLIYLLVGTIAGFGLETMVKAFTKEEVSGWERLSLITLWPFMILLFLINFIIGFFK